MESWLFFYKGFRVKTLKTLISAVQMWTYFAFFVWCDSAWNTCRPWDFGEWPEDFTQGSGQQWRAVFTNGALTFLWNINQSNKYQLMITHLNWREIKYIWTVLCYSEFFIYYWQNPAGADPKCLRWEGLCWWPRRRSKHMIPLLVLLTWTPTVPMCYPLHSLVKHSHCSWQETHISGLSDSKRTPCQSFRLRRRPTVTAAFFTLSFNIRHWFKVHRNVRHAYHYNIVLTAEQQQHDPDSF